MSIGLDIGSSAVRAVEVSVQGAKRELTRFGQLGLPDGAVVEGEVRDHSAVSSALKRLWSEGGFRQRDVVLGISSQRSMVRPVEMPKIATSELRSALRYEMAELLPIPVEQAVFDFVDLGPGRPKGDGGETVQVLLVVAQREIVLDHINVVRRAGLRVRAVDSSPLALLRAFPVPEGGGLEAVVCLGAQLVIVAVREGGVPRFVRTVTRAVDDLAPAVQEGASARSGAPVVTGRRGGYGGMADRADPVIEEIRGSLEYFHSHRQDGELQAVLLTGGGAVGEGVTGRLGASLGVPVSLGAVALSYDLKQLNMTPAQVEEASLRWATAAGLALWGTDGVPAPSLIPLEVRQRRQLHHALAASGAGLLVVALGLGGVSYARAHAASNVAKQVTAENAQAAALQSRIAALMPVTSVHSQLLSRRSIAQQALSGDVDWVGLERRIVAALPAKTNITTLSFSRAQAGASATGGTAAQPPADDVGQVTMSVVTTGGQVSVSQFVRSMWSVPGLYALWVSSTTTAGRQTTFSATAQVTAQAFSKRAAALPGGQP
ncbi:MAG: type IV pilus assembly protein PilM [Acidimicrobiales bacterium]